MSNAVVLLVVSEEAVSVIMVADIEDAEGVVEGAVELVDVDGDEAGLVAAAFVVGGSLAKATWRLFRRREPARFSQGQCS